MISAGSRLRAGFGEPGRNSKAEAAGRHSPLNRTCRLPVAIWWLLLVIATAACGKKGPPLAPFSSLPAAMTAITAKRVGGQIVFQFTVPSANIDGRRPADLDRVDLYVYTARLLRPADYLRRGTIVGSVQVRRPPPPRENGAPAPPAEPGVDQGSVATIVDMPKAAAASDALARATETTSEDGPLFPGGGGPLLLAGQGSSMRYYVAVGVNRRGHPGAPSPVVEVPIVDPPAPPRNVNVTYTEKSLSVSWTAPSIPLGHPIQQVSPEKGGLPSRPIVSFAGSSGYNIYEVPAAKITESVPPDAGLTPLNSSLVSTTTFADQKIEFGTERCFVIRAQETLGSVAVESAASETACVMPADTFAPAPPRSLTAVASEGTISLIWEPNDESDLAGYLILRGAAPGEKLQALTAMPITGATYRDTTIQPGAAYVYAVVAVDKGNNISAHSNRVEERGR